MFTKTEKLKEILLGGHGFLTQKDLEEIEVMFGEDFNIIVRTYRNGRIKLSIKEFRKINREIWEDIRDVFIESDKYYELCSMAGIEK